jgi:hypothetical protein
MGGLMSGRYGGRPTVESTPTLDLYKLIRQGFFRPGHSLSGSIVWTRAGSDEPIGAIDYEAHMTGNKGYVRLRHTIPPKRMKWTTRLRSRGRLNRLVVSGRGSCVPSPAIWSQSFTFRQEPISSHLAGPMGWDTDRNGKRR